jgi:chromosome partitioning protein
MIIIIGNHKGGTGKSTMTLLIANYLTCQKGCPVTVIDMDDQQSIARKFEKDKKLENKEPYQVIPANIESYPALLNLLSCNPREVALIDLSVKLSHNGLIQIFQSADLVICPFAYDEFSFESTIYFSVVLRKINADIPLVFIPNLINGKAKQQTILEVNEQLTKFGQVMPALVDRVDFQRINTFRIPFHLLKLVTLVFEKVYTEYIEGKHERLADMLSENAVVKTAKSVERGEKDSAKQAESKSNILALITTYNMSLNTILVQSLFDKKTVDIMNQFKMATNIEVPRLVSFAVKRLFETNPELKKIIK